MYKIGDFSKMSKVTIKELPSGIVYYKEGVIKNYDELARFVLQTGEECKKLNPDLKCTEPGYCYVNYLDGEYKEENIKIHRRKQIRNYRYT